MPQFDRDVIDFHRLANLLRAKAWIIATVICVTFLAAVGYIVWTPKIYLSRAVIQVPQETRKVFDVSDDSGDKPETLDYLNSVVQAFTSRNLMLRVIKTTGLDKDPSFAPPRRDGSPHTDIELANRIAQKVGISVRRGTRIIDVTVSDENPRMAQKLAVAFIKEFLRENFEQRRGLSRLAREFLQEERQELKAKLEQAERKLQAYRTENKAVSLEERQNIIVEKLKELNTTVTEAKSSRLRIEADLDQFKKINPENVDELLRISSVSKIPQVALIREELLKAETVFAAFKKRYGQGHPKYIEALTSVANLKESLADALSKAGDILIREYEAAREAEEKLDQSLREQEQKAMELNRIAIPYNVLQRDVESDRSLFESVNLRLKETQITGGFDNPPFYMIEDPLVAASPSKPRKKLILAFALVLGVTLGVGVVIGKDAIDSSLRTVDEAESYLELPALATIPDRRSTELMDSAKKMVHERDFSAATRLLREKSRHFVNGSDVPKSLTGKDDLHPLILVKEPGSEQGEAFRTLRASISLLGKKSPFRSFLFTSAIPSEGKTFTALNFASSLAQQRFNTVLVDADMREPRLQNDLLEEAGDVPGLTDLLSGQVELDDALSPTKHDHLVLLPAGSRAPDPAKLLDNEDFCRILEQLLRNHDRVVIDSPPINAVSDTLLIAAYVHATFLVIRAGKTPKRAIRRALQQLEQAGANVPGFIFNRLPLGGGSAAYYYYHYGDRYARNGAHKESEAHLSSGR
ncbi:MAG TPA: polysaccharide biosynthesis tyrosine autokinase [Terrimicrobiaceae bacterium]